ncbi:hypothetical protein [Microbacterium candidum]|uniref:Glycosyltransferase RgtA/B/C/D-like domain-containing protein n=1 Tax=Microbacterium candidum TaxID=3041922 RepID=A0ABT7N370_9MICO|nr:hypothetical protein [Microbacterium sp. ASV49]MDL9981149.1 hypothetical protein [Microbacterium sp. ASV49]
MPSPRPRPRPPVWARELAGLLAACAMALIVVGHLASDPARGNLLLLDPDSMLNQLVVSSLHAGQGQDWAMSPVLFIPEIGLYWLISLLGLNVSATLLVSAVVNVVLLYGAVRLVAGRRERLAHPVTGALLTYGLYCILALLESGGDRDSMELASLLATTTYYAMSVLAAVVTIGLVRRILGRTTVIPVIALALVGLVSAFTNPLFALWATAPAALALIAVGRRALSWRVLLIVEGALIVPAAIGIFARTPLKRLIVANPDLYAKPDQWQQSIAYYFGLVVDLTRTPGGWAEIALVLLLLALPLVATALTRRADDRFLAVVGWLSPLVTVVWAIAFGTVAARYLQPLVYLPLLTAVLVPTFVCARVTWTRARVRALRIVAAVAAVVLIALAAVQPARIADASARAEASVACVVDWIDHAGRTGAGQFWTIRPVKARLADPARLLQTGPDFVPYLWLVNRQDYPGAKITFAVTDAASFPFQYPAGAQITDLTCGSYTIHDFRDTPVFLP